MLLLQKQQTIGEIRYGAFAPFLEEINIFLYENSVVQLKQLVYQ
jgi:hypothetical protein